ncbi:hypothetical protein PtA15_8A167 [Puccinia triticina]|uniref:Uncharacterized protein n=1 Tax=Puccinia triticina TaxID=208348 RepID=A0ABY7CPT6_9BASI|nr:uncharacterized protein PtA15_8A167 [Puccinia triticina]WAQ87263.1 hypothetical protein PtA15_8A167 [Puccinia triticina]
MDKDSPQLVDKDSPQLVDEDSPQLVDKDSPQPVDEDSPQLVDEDRPQLVDLLIVAKKVWMNDQVLATPRAPTTIPKSRMRTKKQ